jgi:intracellular septation protein A
LSTLGLSILMLFGIITRILVKDSIIKTLPAIFYSLLNTYLFVELIFDFL